MTENDLVELYCTIDDFYQCFIKTEPGKKNLAEYYGKHGPKRSMSVPGSHDTQYYPYIGI
nr:hypothetical protein [uncultured Treponema sp.]